jgi:membrane-associated phospholipid phosphatase
MHPRFHAYSVSHAFVSTWTQWILHAPLFSGRFRDWMIVIAIMIVGFSVNKFVAPHEKLIVSAHDEALSYPVMPQTVPEAYLAVGAFLVPLMLVCGMCEFLKDRRDMHVSAIMLAQSVSVSVLLTTLAKKQAGRPRPNFYAMCGWSNNMTSTGVAGCTAAEHWQWESRQSFPSGHSSFAFAGMVYLSLFLLDKVAILTTMRRMPVSLPASAAQLAACLPCLAAIWVAITRVVDYWFVRPPTAHTPCPHFEPVEMQVPPFALVRICEYSMCTHNDLLVVMEAYKYHIGRQFTYMFTKKTAR